MGIATILKDKGGEVFSVPPQARVADVIAALVERRIGAVLVCDGESVVGIVSERDVIRCLLEHKGAVLELTAAQVMTAPVITIRPEDSVVEAMELMTDRRIRHLPVVESGHLTGLVSIGDLVKRRIAEAEQEALALKDYITAG
jgi:CBS domain-containing protein